MTCVASPLDIEVSIKNTFVHAAPLDLPVIARTQSCPESTPVGLFRTKSVSAPIEELPTGPTTPHSSVPAAIEEEVEEPVEEDQLSTVSSPRSAVSPGGSRQRASTPDPLDADFHVTPDCTPMGMQAETYLAVC